MAGPGFQLGSFTGGLFSGAQSVFGLYKDYQGIVTQELANSIADQQRGLTKDRKPTDASRGLTGPATQDFTQAPGQTAPTQTPAPTPTVAPGAPDERRPITPSDSASSQPDYSRSITPNAPSDSAASAPIYNPPPPPVVAPPVNPRAGLLSTSPPRPASPGVTGRGGAGVQPPSPATSYTDPNDPGYRYPGSPVSPGVQSDVDAHDGVQGLPLNPNPMPITRTAPVNQPIPSAQIGGPYTPPPQVNPAPPQQQGPTAPIPHNPPGYDAQPNTAPVNAPIPGAQGGPYTPPPQVDTRGLPPPQPPNVPSIAPALPPPQQVAPSPATPMGGSSSLGGRILSYMPSLMGSAHAAEVTPARQVGQGDPNAPAPTPTASGGPNLEARPTGITPAQPPTTPPASQQGPVVVQGEAGKVAPGQTAPSLQSQQTPVRLAPPLNVGPWMEIQKSDPRMAKVITNAVDNYGGGVVNYEEVAALFKRESSFDPSRKGGAGEMGLGQIMPDTWKGLADPSMDPWKAEDNAAVTVTYLKQIANSGGGAHTVQTHLAYMRGNGGVNEAKAQGWETYARHNPIAANGVASIFSPDAKLSTEMFVAGKSGGDQYVKNVIQAAHRDGPDGALTVIGEQGPEGLGMTDRIRNLQADMEAWLIRSGHMDKVPMAQEWVAQTMHQGTVSHLVAADAALLRGDTTGAINHLMKGNGFFPDGAYARAGVDKSGNIWAYRITEKGDNVIGKPFQVTHEGLQTQIVALQNPTTFQKTLQAMQKENAGIDLHRAQTEWYKARPEIEAMKDETRRQLQADRDQIARDRMDEKTRNDKERAIRIAEHNTHLEEEANKLYPADADLGADTSKFTAEEYPVAANIYRQLRKHPEAGGANLSSVDAYRLANGLAAGVSQGSKNAAFELRAGKLGADGKPLGYGIVDKSGKVLKTLNYEQGELVKGIVGLAGSAPLQAPGTAPPSTTAPALPRPQFTPAPAASPPIGAQPGARTDTAPGMIVGALPMQGLSRAA